MSKWHKIEMVGDSGDYLEEAYCPGHGIEEIGLGYNVELKCFESGFYTANLGNEDNKGWPHYRSGEENNIGHGDGQGMGKGNLNNTGKDNIENLR